MSDIRTAAINFEAVKVSMSQTKDGVILRLAVHPNECPPSLHTDWVGSRYMVAMVRLNDEDQPMISEQQAETNKLIASAGLLCRNDEFQKFMQEVGLIADDVVPSEDKAVDAMRSHLGIRSRSDLNNNSEAREAFKVMRDEFTKWKKGYKP